jgi:hypothetical protein
MKSTAEKLLIKPDAAVWPSHADRLGLLGPLPAGTTTATGMGKADVAVVFADDAAGLRKILTKQRANLLAPTVLWIAYPKGNRTDINRDSVWPILSEYGMRPITQVALDETWSALRFRALKEGEVFTGGA